MTIIDMDHYQQHLKAREPGRLSLVHELWLPMLLFAGMGAITWAIRGTAGWGGVDGTVLSGLTWGLIWYYLSRRKGIDASSIVFWLGMGIALGGELGYGQYTGWILGRFSVGDEVLAISPITGYWWFFLCGIGWAAPGGILLGWALAGRVSTGKWIARILLIIPLFIFLFAWPVVDWFAAIFVKTIPGLLFPHADMGLYTGELDKHLGRTVYTNSQNFLVVVWWIAALIIAAIHKDKKTLVSGLIIGGGFGFGFMQSAAWCLGYGSARGYIDWWKVWEINSGFNLGILYAIVWYWSVKQLDKQQLGKDDAMQDGPVETIALNRKRMDTILLTIAGFVLIYFAGFEYFPQTGMFLCLFFAAAMLLTLRTREKNVDLLSVAERRNQILLIYSAFLLVFLLFHGGSERAGVIMELYGPDAVDQYAWPVARIILFAPVALIITGVAVYRIWQVLKVKRFEHVTATSTLSNRMADLFMVTGFIGALSIWPAKIGVLYALIMIFVIFAHTRLEQRFAFIDGTLGDGGDL